MLFNHIKSNLNVVDSEFDSIYSDKIQAIADLHFTPIKVSRTAARYLASKGEVKILDIGAGAGKFCMIGSVCTKAYFTGVEQRRSLCSAAQMIAQDYNLTNVEFINSNIMNISFKDFDAFYFYNSFFENISRLEKIDDEVEARHDLYIKYSMYVKEQLDSMPIGTKLATFHSFLKEVPDSYQVKHSAFGDKLKMWEKVA